VILQRLLAFSLAVGTEADRTLSRQRLETFLYERLAEKPQCYLANTLLAMLIANPTLQESPDFAKASELLQIAKQAPLVASIDYAEQVLNLWQGEIEKVKPWVERSPQFKHYLRAIESPTFEPSTDGNRLTRVVDEPMLFDFLIYDATLIPHGFYRDVAFARDRRMAIAGGDSAESP